MSIAVSQPTGLPSAETIVDGENVLAILVRRNFKPGATEFITTPDSVQQVGLVVYPAGGVVKAHRHPPVEREIRGTPETLMIRMGAVDADLYSSQGALVRTIRLEEGDVIILIDGGHGFRMIEDTVILEVKQGPYLGIHDKVQL